MGQKCPCYTNKSTEENTFFNLNEEPKSYKNRKYEELIFKSRMNNSTTIVPDDSNETNNMFEDMPIDKIKTLQNLARRIYFINRIKAYLEQETKNIYEDMRNLFTTDNLRLAEKKFPTFQLIDNIIEPSFLLHSKIIISNDGRGFYSGQINMNSQKHGRGVLLKDNGCKYEGIWKDDKFMYGRYIDIEGNIYEGYFSDYKLNGLGSYATLSSYNYEGNFLENEKSGIGKEETCDYIYEGEFKNNMKQGHGKQTFKQLEDIFIGEFKEDKINGNGCYYFKNGEKYNGSFEDGMMHGNGTYTWPDGSEYSGDYLNNLKHGNGLFKMNNGKVYEGQFWQGKPHGKGKLTSSKGVVANVEFVDGKLLKRKDPNRKTIKK